jgi:hypothetical protein
MDWRIERDTPLITHINGMTLIPYYLTPASSALWLDCSSCEIWYTFVKSSSPACVAQMLNSLNITMSRQRGRIHTDHALGYSFSKLYASRERQSIHIMLYSKKNGICFGRQGQPRSMVMSTDQANEYQHVVRRERVVNDHKELSPPSRTYWLDIHVYNLSRLQKTNLPVSYDHFLFLFSIPMHIVRGSDGERRVKPKLPSTYSTALTMPTDMLDH